MAMKAVQVVEVPGLDRLPESVVSPVLSGRPFAGVEGVKSLFMPSKFLVIGHRGSGMNRLNSVDRRMKAIKENSIESFKAAGSLGADFVEFDVQVTKDDYPVIFHDIFILSKEEGIILEKRLTDLTLHEFSEYGPHGASAGKSLMRRMKDGSVFGWNVEEDHPLCTLQDAFQNVNPSLGFNIELKFDDGIPYDDHSLLHVLKVVLEVVCEYACDRPIVFSSFQPDAARLVRQLQTVYPVFFLTNGGQELYTDTRRNSLDEALKWCQLTGLQGVVSEVKAVLKDPSFVAKIKEANLSLLSYGQLNNVKEAVCIQHLMGVDGVIVDLVKEITEVVPDLLKLSEKEVDVVHNDSTEKLIESLAQFNYLHQDSLSANCMGTSIKASC